MRLNRKKKAGHTKEKNISVRPFFNLKIYFLKLVGMPPGIWSGIQKLLQSHAQFYITESEFQRKNKRRIIYLLDGVRNKTAPIVVTIVLEFISIIIFFKIHYK